MGGYVNTYALLKDFLPAATGITKVMRRVPSNLPHAVPLLIVARFGGVDTTITVDRPNVQIDVYASTEDSAEELGEDVRTAMRVKLPHRMFGGATVGEVRTLSGPQLLAWNASTVFRCSARYQLAVHQYTGIS